MKKPTIIVASDVPRVFSNANVRQMAKRVGYAPAESPDVAEAVRAELLALLEDLARPTTNEVHYEIDTLVRAAIRATKARKQPGHWCERVADLVKQLSPATRKIMDRRGTLPHPATLRDPATQLDACHTILGLGRLGVSHKEGRKRAGGARSVAEVPELLAPPLQQRPLRHERLIVFVQWLVNVDLRATGEMPEWTANFYHPGSFAKFLQACLDAAEIEASAIKLLGSRRWRHQVKNLHQKRLNDVIGRWDRTMHANMLRWARDKIIESIRQRYRLSLSNR